MYWLMGSLVLFLGVYVVRAAYGVRPSPRCKDGESQAEAKTILLGTYRLYSWVLFTNVVLAFAGTMGEGEIRSALWFRVAVVCSAAVLMLLAHVLYWRLGYDWRRYVFVLGHLSGAFGVAEFFYALRSDIKAHPHQDGPGI